MYRQLYGFEFNSYFVEVQIPILTDQALTFFGHGGTAPTFQNF